MLVSLTIADIVLVDRLTVPFSGNLCALTGETGAGKSILLDALSLALGARADTGLIRHGQDSASVTATIDRPATGIAADAISALINETGLPDEDPLILRRQISRDGRSRAFVNDHPVSVGTLRRIGDALVEIHGQFETHGLLDPARHLDLLDGYAGAAEPLAAVRDAWRVWRQAELERQSLMEGIERAQSEEAYLRHAVAELDTLAPEVGEEDALASDRQRLMNREKLAESFAAALSTLDGDDGAGPALARARRHLERAAEKAGLDFTAVLDGLDRAETEVAEVIAAVDAARHDMDGGTRSLDQVEERLFALRNLARKHRCASDNLPALRSSLHERLAMIDDQTSKIAGAGRACAAAKDAYLEAAHILSDTRKAAAKRFDQAVTAELGPLKLGHATFVTDVTNGTETQWGPGGIDKAQFLVSTNPAVPPGPLQKIASGGEMARFMLAMKVALREIDGVPTLIFDEVDTGIGGAVADAVGERLAKLGRGAQVLVVTHSPQIAARAGHHLQVEKEIASDGGARSSIRLLTAEERAEEIARMLSGAEISSEARAAAERLLAAG